MCLCLRNCSKKSRHVLSAFPCHTLRPPLSQSFQVLRCVPYFRSACWVIVLGVLRSMAALAAYGKTKRTMVFRVASSLVERDTAAMRQAPLEITPRVMKEQRLHHRPSSSAIPKGSNFTEVFWALQWVSTWSSRSGQAEMAHGPRAGPTSICNCVVNQPPIGNTSTHPDRFG